MIDHGQLRAPHRIAECGINANVRCNLGLGQRLGGQEVDEAAGIASSRSSGVSGDASQILTVPS